jgi:hypothetical protein
MAASPPRRALRGALVAAAIAAVALLWTQHSRPRTLARAALAALRPFTATQPVRDSLALERFELALSDADVDHLQRLQDLFNREGPASYQQQNRWRPGRLRFAGRWYPMKFKSHGDSPFGQSRGRDVSLSIKLADSAQIHHANRFTLLVYPRVVKGTDLVRFTAQRLGLAVQRSHPVRVRFADGYENVYHFEYRMSRSAMSDLNRPTWVRLGFDSLKSSLRTSSRAGDDPEAWQHRADTALEQRLQDLALATAHADAIRDWRRGLTRAIDAQDEAAVVGFFDRRYLVRFEAFRLIVGAWGHGFGLGNDFIYYDTCSGRFYPVQHRDIFQNLLAQRPTLERMTYGMPETRYPLWELLSRDDALRQDKYRLIHELATEGGLAAALRTEERRLDGEDRDWFNDLPLWVQPLWLPGSPVPAGPPARAGRSYKIRANLSWLQQQLTEAAPEARMARSGEALWILVRPHALAALSLAAVGGQRPERVRVSWRDGHGRIVVRDAAPEALALADGLDAELQRTDRAYLIRLERAAGGTLPEPSLSLVHSLTGVAYAPGAPLLPEPDPEMLALAVEPPAQRDPSDALRALSAELPLVSTGPGQLSLPAGAYRLERDLVLPQGTDLTLQAGVHLRLGAGASLLVRGALVVQGRQDAPVRIEALDPAHPFGSLAALGDGTGTCELSWLQVSGGSQDYLLGAHFSGSVSLYHQRLVRMRHGDVRGSQSDDGLNVKYARVEIEDSTFRDNLADQVDVDTATGVIRRCQFGGEGSGDDNGDGLDVSFSPIAVVDSTFEGLRDKGISVGEKSTVLIDGNLLRKSGLAVAVKGSSRAIFGSNRFEGNRTDLFAYKKLKSFGSGTSFLVGPGPHPESRFGDPDSKLYEIDAAAAALPPPERFSAQAGPVLQRLTAQARSLEAQPRQFVMP